jgi:hypothetical protein
MMENPFYKKNIVLWYHRAQETDEAGSGSSYDRPCEITKVMGYLTCH